MSDEPLVHVIDDDDAVRESLDFLLSTAAFAVRTYETATRFLDTLSDRTSGCVVTDVRMPEMTGIELLKRLSDIQAELPVVVITGQADVPLAVEAMRLGAVDFLEKPIDDDVLIASIRSAMRARELEHSREAEQRKFAQRVEALSRREREVLDGLLAGQPNKTIAFDLGISPRTVEIYRANLMTKMEAESLSHLVRMTLIADVMRR